MDHQPDDASEDGAAALHERRALRDSMFLLAELDLGGEPPHPVTRVRNISEGGMMAEGAPALDVGQALTVTLRGIGSVRGQVAWVDGSRAGIAFDEPIDPRRTRKPVSGQRAVRRKPVRLRPVP